MTHPPHPAQVTVKVIGVGSAAGKMMSHRAGASLHGQGVILLDTDAQALRLAQAALKLGLQDNHTRGLGAGGSPDVGQRAAEATAEAIHTVLAGADMVVLAAGLGGGTGTGAAPVVARIARELGALTVGIVTTPFGFEGARRRRLADDALALLVETVDTLIVVSNNSLLQTGTMKMSMQDAFAQADAVVQQGVVRITESIRRPGSRPLGFDALRRLLEGAGRARLATAQAHGPRRGHVAVLQASDSPLLDGSLTRAHRVLVLCAGHHVTGSAVDEIAATIATVTSPAATIAIGTIDDLALQDEVEVTVIACALEDPTASRGVPPPGPTTEPPAPLPSPVHPPPRSSGPLRAARRPPASDES